MYPNLEQYLEYSIDSPSFLIWKVSVPFTNIQVGDVAGSLDLSRGYYVTTVQGRKYKNHRIIYYLHKKTVSDLVDHIDGNRLNNHIDNLRIVTTTINNRNLSVRKDSKTGVSGINLLGNRYIAIYFDNKKKKTKSFCCSKLGQDLAFKKACNWRSSRLKEMNVGYTERHGT
jgi:hypothetical protein